jgi:predicted O-linked N-acetylglucosamine transferase (SPINDLY family)
MASLPEALAVAVRHHQAGRLQAAEQLYRQILAAQPDHPGALHLLGVVAQQTGRHEAAVEYIEKAIALDGRQPPFHNNLGEAYRALRRTPDAIASYRRALELKPDFAGAHYNLGNAWKDLGQLMPAIDCYRRAVELRPDYVEAHNNLGNALRGRGQLAEAIACFRRALELKPDFAEARANLARTVADQGPLAVAKAGDWPVLPPAPNDAEVHYRTGNALRLQRRFADAMACYRRAVALKPDYVEAHNNLGAVLKDQGRFAEAAACYRTALGYNPAYAEAHNNLGGVFWEQGDLDQALSCFRRALELKPDYADAHHNRGVLLKDMGQVSQAVECYRRALQIRPDFVACHSNLVYLLYFCPGYDAAAICEEHQRWNRQHAATLANSIGPHANDRSPDRRLRVGYVSPDFRRHPVGRFLLPLLESHDHQGFEIFCYASVPDPDEITARCRAQADTWQDVLGVADAELADLIRRDQVFARKPAPVQVTYLAYCGTTGLGTMDYRLTDPYLDPPGPDDRFYSEQSIRLPETYWCYRPASETPPVNALPAREAGHVTFGSLNNFCKVSPAALAAWSRVLQAVPGSRLLLHAQPGSHRDGVRAFLAEQGISAERLAFAGSLPAAKYFALYQGIDVALDTFPYGGGTTSCDALWMGVPVVSLAGQTAVGRGGLSILSNLGLTELVAHDEQQYVRIAAELAHDLPRLAGLRAALRQRMQDSPLTDAPRFARNVEAAYRRMWRRWCAG